MTAYRVVLGVAGLALLAGCGEGPMPFSSRATEPTADQIEQELQVTLEPMLNTLALPPDTPVDPNLFRSIPAALAAAVEKHRGRENGPEALQRIERQCEDFTTRAYDTGRWSQALLGCAALAVLNPDNYKIPLIQRVAKTELNRPQVVVKGIAAPSGGADKVIFLDIYLPETGETKQGVRAKVGDTLYGMEILRILENDRAIEYEYVPTGKTYQVPYHGR